MSQTALPVWAVRRVETILSRELSGERTAIRAEDLARRAGLSKNLARRCMKHVGRRGSGQFLQEPGATTGSDRGSGQTNF
jgi:hypothetical protein